MCFVRWLRRCVVDVVMVVRVVIVSEACRIVGIGARGGVEIGEIKSTLPPAHFYRKAFASSVSTDVLARCCYGPTT